MRIVVDREACVGSATCVLAAPDVFDQDDEDGRVVVRTPPSGPQAWKAALEAQKRCPVGAIRVVMEPPGTG